MKVIDQSLDHITVYDFHGGQIRKSLRYDSLSSMMHSFAKYVQPDLQDRMVRLLDEQLFSFHRFEMRFTSSTPCTIKDLKKIIDTKIARVTQDIMIDSPYVLHRLSHKYVNGKQTDFVLGKTGEIAFCLELCLLLPEGVSMCELLGGSFVFSHPCIQFYPRNYYTIQYLNQTITQDTYSLLFIENEMSQLICVSQGRYTNITYINIGMRLLKSCYQEHDVEKYFYMSRDDIQQNQFLTKVIDEAVSFFTDTLSKRVYQYIDTNAPLIVAGDIIQNPSFLPLFQDSYRNYGSGYILPLQSLQHTAYEHTFASHEITVSSYLKYA